jgi:hypothetical protein
MHTKLRSSHYRLLLQHVRARLMHSAVRVYSLCCTSSNRDFNNKQPHLQLLDQFKESFKRHCIALYVHNGASKRESEWFQNAHVVSDVVNRLPLSHFCTCLLLCVRPISTTTTRYCTYLDAHRHTQTCHIHTYKWHNNSQFIVHNNSVKLNFNSHHAVASQNRYAFCVHGQRFFNLVVDE